MGHEIVAGVISKHAFVSPTSLKFSGYIAYMSRSEAVRTESYASHNFAFDDMDVQHLGPFHVLDALHGLDEPNDVVSVLWTEISDVQALEHVSLVG